MRKINYIVLHCSATKETSNVSFEAIDRMHKERGFKVIVGGKEIHIGYHYYITKDGVIHQGRPIEVIGAHVKGYNANSIGICYEGGLDKNGKVKDTRTDAQKESMHTLVNELRMKFKTAKVVGHRDLSPDLNKDGKITPNEWLKACPCFEVKDEFK